MWDKKPFGRARAWIDMLMLTNYKDGQIRVRGIPIEVKRGQLGWSIKRLSHRWGWSEGKVKRFFKELESDNQIEVQNGEQNIKLSSLITIINYDKYQTNEEENDTKTENRRRTDGEQTETNKKDKKLKKEKKTYITPHLGSHKNVKVTEREVIDLKAYVGSESVASDLVERLSLYLASSGNTYASHYATMQTWYRKDKNKADNSNGAVVRETF
jgi:hypothetical protein